MSRAVLDDQTQDGPGTTMPARLFSVTQALFTWRNLPETFVLATLLFLLTYSISYFPHILLEEGNHLHVPKNVILYGEYAERTSEGFNYYGPGVSLGPTVMGPVILSFKAFGIGLMQARLISGIYILATALVVYLAARHLFGRPVAACSALLLLVAPGFVLSHWWEGGRVVGGEVPALFFLLAGYLYFWKHLGDLRSHHLVTAGSLIGLAFITKNQFPLIVFPSLLIIGILGRYYYRTIHLRQIATLVSAAMMIWLIWFIVQIFLIGGGNVLANVDSIRSASNSNYAVFSPSVTQTSLRYLVSLDVYYGWLIAGLAYGAILSTRRTADGFKAAMLTITITMWLSWYAFASIGIPRYAYPALQISTIFIAKLFIDLIGDFSKLSPKSLLSNLQQRDLAPARGMAMLLILCLIIGSPLDREFRATLSAEDRTQQQFAGYLVKAVPETAVIETFEYSMGFLTNHNFHYPPNWTLNMIQAHVAGKASEAYTAYNPLDHDPEYLVLGHNSSAVPVLYSDEFVKNCWTLEHAIGSFELYQRNGSGNSCYSAGGSSTDP